MNQVKTAPQAAQQVKIIGRVEGGKFHAAPACLIGANNGQPTANVAFVAVNAPFKTI